MSNSVRIGRILSSAALACVLAGCASPQGRTAVATSFGGKAGGEVGLAMRALAALNANDAPKAIGFAERAVARTPDDAGFRTLLGNAYFAAGRFASAEAAFKDSLAIYSNQPQIVLKLALVEIAQGKSSEALAFLDAARNVLDPADYGLALALAGRAPEAVVALRDLSRTTGADARVRQNLALAYALAGDWPNARTIAAQDLGPDKVDARIKQWMQLAKPVRASDQVAALTGVSPAASDPGQPVQLAWRKVGTQTAAVAPQPQLQVTVSLPAPQPIAAVVEPDPYVAEIVPPAPPPVDVARLPAFAASEESVPAAAPAYYVPPPPAARPAFTRAAAPLRKLTRAPRASAPMHNAVLRRGGSTAVVQLGAYASPQRVLAAWNSAARRHSGLRAYAPMSARFASAHGPVYRLSVRGFVSQNEAGALCSSLHRSGGSCFVRTVAGDAPVQIASR
ncbi:MAG: tetratricopeptide repeat protein [Sphingomicrobium sp.]